MKSITRDIATGIVFVVSAPAAFAGLFDNPENLKVLPEDISAAELRNTMRGFSFATGFRCEGCHVGEAGQPLDVFDFPSDEKETKKKARIMLKMVKDINQGLEKELGNESNALVKVQCMTCHRGQNKPIMLEDLLINATTEEGLAASIEKYRELRTEYYGSHTFDFSEMTLMTVAERLARDKQTDSALAYLDLNLEFYPRSWMSYVSQGQILSRTDQKDTARTKIKSALEIEPDNTFVQGLLKELD